MNQDAADRLAIRERQLALSECIKLQKAVEQLARMNPVDTAVWLRKAFEQAPSVEPAG